MAELGFYQANEFRAYPFVEAQADTSASSEDPGLPEQTIVDFGCSVGPGSEYSSGSDLIRLHRIARSGDSFRFEFRSTAPGLYGRSLVFDRTLTDAEYAAEFVASIDSDIASETSVTPDEDSDVCGIVLWEGFLVTGRLDDLAALLPDGEEILSTRFVVEPANVQNLEGWHVYSINVANAPRTRATPTEGCGDPDTDYPEDGIVHGICGAGPLRFVPGYSAQVRLSASDNSVLIGAAPGAGEGAACAEIPLFDGETGPNGAALLTGGPPCSSVITRFNGLRGPHVQIQAGPGLRLAPSVGNLDIVVDYNGLATCTEGDA